MNFTIGQKIHKLTLLELSKNGKYYGFNCLCECGKIKFYRKSQFKDDLIKSCGCAKIKAYTPNEKIGNLKVIQYVGRKRWEFLCDCGNSVFRKAGFEGNKKFHGCKDCIKKQQQLKTKEKHHLFNPLLEHNRSIFRWKYDGWKRGAKIRNFSWDLTPEQLNSLWDKQKELCYYSNIKMNLDQGPYVVSLDRIDSKKGYYIDNVVFCCAMVNEMKSDFPIEIFLDMCNKISSFVKDRKINNG